MESLKICVFYYVNNFAYSSSWGHLEVVWCLIQFLLPFQVRLFDHRKTPEAVKKYIWPRGTFEWDIRKWPFVFLTHPINFGSKEVYKKCVKSKQTQNFCFSNKIFVVIWKTLMSLHIIMSCWLHYSKLCKETKKCDKIASNNNTQLASFFSSLLCFTE